jgi:hypothetical protein
VKIGVYRGLDICLKREWHSTYAELRGKLKYSKDLGESPLGNITRIENLLEEIPKTLTRFETELADVQKQLEIATAEIGKPFEHEERLSGLITRQSQLNIELEHKELQNKPDGENFQAAFVKENFAILESFAPEILYNNRNYMRFVSNGYSDLVLRRVDENIIKIAYYYENGVNRLRDPEVTLKVNMDDKTLIPVSYYQDTMRVKQDVYDKNGHLNEKLLSDIDTFLHDWLTDIPQYEYELSRERQPENELPFFDEKEIDFELDFEDESTDEYCDVAV